MIRMIAADLDGTLLNGRRELSPRLFPVIRALAKRGVRFVAASGRQYYNLLDLFAPVRDEVIFLSENGTMVFDRGEAIAIEEIPREMWTEPLAAIRALPGAYPIFCGTRCGWIEDDDAEFLRNASLYYLQRRQVASLERECNDRICKIAVFDVNGAEAHSYPALERFRGKFAVTLSGFGWSDLMLPGVDKGSAMRHLQQRYGIKPEECMAFGDYLNDLELLASCGVGCAMGNAHESLKKIATRVVGSNEEDGVVEAILQEFPNLL